jgi:hypothetical protein
MTTYLKDLAQSIGRYGGLSKIGFGLSVFGCTSSIPTWCGIFLARKGIGQAPHVKGSMTI